ncbi:MAG: SurA N-terminal domain-containing protein [Paenirhodobacter sp.]|uniref:peptidylprolyl isomerase n=1 Tax=Paenirhodobacter sp. TaxID=1965326 RepID=UPI003D0F33C3
MSTRLRSHGKSMVVWVLLAMLVLGLGGFGVRNFSGRVQTIGTVGETEITTGDYARALRAEMSAAQAQIGRPLSFAEAKSFGIDRQVQAQLFSEAAMSEEARRLGISAGDGEITDQIRQIKAFQGVDGKFDRETYRLALRQQGMTEPQFEAQLRADIARSILQGAVASGLRAPATLSQAYATYLTETRDLAWAEITPADLPEQVGTPSDEQLKAWYDDHIGEFTKPETREISYLWLTPEMLKDKVTIDDATLQAAYQERIGDYVQPERRRVDKLVYPTEEEAAAAKAKFEAGASFADLASDRGLTLADTDLGEVSKDELGTAGDAVFALTAPGIVGPIATDLGPALFQMNGIVPAETTSFEEAKPDLLAEAQIDRARRMIGDLTSDLEDKLASGATLEELAKESDMELGKISIGPDTKDGIAAYENFRDAAAKVTAEDFPELANLEDGGIFALRLDGVTPAAPIPFDEVKDKVAESWRAAELARLKTARAEAIVAAVNGGAGLGAQGVIVAQAAHVARDGYLEGVPANLVATAFATAPGQAAVAAEGGQVFVVQPERAIEAEAQSDDFRKMQDQLGTRIEQSMANDLTAFYARAVEAEAGITIDSAAINAVQAQMQ